MIGNIKIAMLRGEKGDTGATGDYSGILNKPQINGVTLSGNKTSADLGLATETAQQNLQENVTGLNSRVGDIETDIDTINETLTDINADITEINGKLPFVTTADIDTLTNTVTNISHTATEIYVAAAAGRTCVLMLSTGVNNRYMFAVLEDVSQAAGITVCKYISNYDHAQIKVQDAFGNTTVTVEKLRYNPHGSISAETGVTVDKYVVQFGNSVQAYIAARVTLNYTPPVAAFVVIGTLLGVDPPKKEINCVGFKNNGSDIAVCKIDTTGKVSVLFNAQQTSGTFEFNINYLVY